MKAIFARAKEVRETSDNAEAARLVQTGNWIIVQAALQGDAICWVLIRFSSQGMGVPQAQSV